MKYFAGVVAFAYDLQKDNIAEEADSVLEGIGIKELCDVSSQLDGQEIYPGLKKYFISGVITTDKWAAWFNKYVNTPDSQWSRTDLGAACYLIEVTDNRWFWGKLFFFS